MKKSYFLFLVLLSAFTAQAQELRLKKGAINENLPVIDSIGQDLSIYLPSDFDPAGSWPVLFVCDFSGDTNRALRYFQGAAESNGYILAASRKLVDSTQLTDGVLRFARSLEFLHGILPLDKDRLYASGIGKGGEFASLMPNLVRAVSGVLTAGAGPPNTELLNAREPFDYVALLSRSDYRYPNMRLAEEPLSRKRLDHHQLYYNGSGGLPDEDLLGLGVATLTLLAIKAGVIPTDSVLVRQTLQGYRSRSDVMRQQGDVLVAYNMLEQAIDLFDGLADTGDLKDAQRSLRRTSAYRTRKREAANLALKEEILRQDYAYYLEEDVLNFNLDNLGWWRHQLETIAKYKAGASPEDQRLGLRLEGYLRALADDYIRIARTAGEQPDDDALVLLHMLKTLIDPEVPANYLTVISLASKYDDFGTALFYLEELLKTGYADRQRLYDLEHTALLRISPEFNALVEKYLQEARYEIPE
ncbi:alpha/beta hydrolase [Robiginitalea biformata]|uniref:alpha/beta hydrolase n=1 Tax=Robiginitalea biformata TaxID=252307 RepID=UPI003B5AEC8C